MSSWYSPPSYFFHSRFTSKTLLLSKIWHVERKNNEEEERESLRSTGKLLEMTFKLVTGCCICLKAKSSVDFAIKVSIFKKNDKIRNVSYIINDTLMMWAEFVPENRLAKFDPYVPDFVYCNWHPLPWVESFCKFPL